MIELIEFWSNLGGEDVLATPPCCHLLVHALDASVFDQGVRGEGGKSSPREERGQVRNGTSPPHHPPLLPYVPSRTLVITSRHCPKPQRARARCHCLAHAMPMPTRGILIHPEPIRHPVPSHLASSTLSLYTHAPARSSIPA